jgi:hypothetical protein
MGFLMLNKNTYKSFLEALQDENYTFVFFDNRYSFDKVILLRHDIDVDLEAALQLAKIENELNIVSTYFIMLRSPMYNLFSRANINIVKEIISLGHKLALHYDAFNAVGSTLQQDVDLEIDILNKVFNVDISTVSFHQPCTDIINNNFKIRQINTYDMKDIFYISDSNANDRVLNTKLLFQYEKIQILVHPMWWIMDDFVSTEKSWDNSIMNNFYREEKQLLLTERAYGEKRCLTIV